ncbi:MAG TPA: glycine oxidase ThiO [Rhizomicrobium sp.]|nr:glycine oxidase ThiO [Rhizomicrobium sp.]
MKIVIVGAGVAGLSIGWRLAAAGAEVTILERAQPGRGATWASAGMISTTAETGESVRAEADFAKHSARMWPHFAREIEEASGIDVGYRVDGTLIVARSADEAAALSARAKGSPALEFLVPDGARALEPLLAPDILGALYDPDEAHVDNRALGIALTVAFRRAGGNLQTNEAVVRFDIYDGRVIGALTPFALHKADAFILAAGAWSGQIDGLPPEIVPPIVPVKGEMIALDPIGAALPKHVIWGNGVYLVPRRGRLLVGATVSRDGFDSRPRAAAAQWLFDRAATVLPALTDWTLAEHWAGLRPGSPDDLPVLGRSAVENLFIASGQFRNGILFAPAIADLMFRLVMKGEAELESFSPLRFC